MRTGACLVEALSLETAVGRLPGCGRWWPQRPSPSRGVWCASRTIGKPMIRQVHDAVSCQLIGEGGLGGVALLREAKRAGCW